jgi:hypothetical protein
MLDFFENNIINKKLSQPFSTRTLKLGACSFFCYCVCDGDDYEFTSEHMNEHATNNSTQKLIRNFSILCDYSTVF